MQEHLSRRATRRHDLGLAFAGIAAATAPAQGPAWPRPRTLPFTDAQPHAAGTPRSSTGPALRPDAN